ncbi:MAG: peptide chain release factor H, partial [Hyphomicrobiaceae bacterium]
MKRLMLTSGRGPVECRIALAKALALMADEAAHLGLSFDKAEGATPDRHGPASAIVAINGKAAAEAAFAVRWLGTVQWVAQSTIRPHHRRKNWFIGVSELPVTSAVAYETLKDSDVRFESFRAGGAGGQHQNTTDSAVRATHLPTGLCVVARDERSQHRNKAIALKRLAHLLESRAELAHEASKQFAQASHDELERGRPVRCF